MNTASLKQDYQDRIVPILMKEFGYTTVMQCPKLTKIVFHTDKELLIIVQNSVPQGLFHG